MTLTKTEVKNRARRLLRAAGVEGPPVPVEAVAKACGAFVRYRPYSGDFSGLLARTGKQWVIGINSLDAPARQRFSVAHELGHLLLHAPTEPHIDHARDFQVRFERGPAASAGIDPNEIAANQFAAELLMPEAFLREDLKGTPLHLIDAEDLIANLAERYEVSQQAMTIRLTTLGFLSLLGA